MSEFRSVTQKRIAWSIADVAAKTGLSTGFVRSEIKRGKLAVRRTGRRVLILDRELRRYLGTR